MTTMTTPSPTVAAPPPWDENRMRDVIRSHKPFTPRLRAALERLVYSARAYEQAYAECLLDAALTGAPDLSRLRVTARRLGKARRAALIAMGLDPESDLFPAEPTIPYDA